MTIFQGTKRSFFGQNLNGYSKIYLRNCINIDYFLSNYIPVYCHYRIYSFLQNWIRNKPLKGFVPHEMDDDML